MKKVVCVLLTAVLMMMMVTGCGQSGANDSKEDLSLQEVTSKGKFVLGLDDAFPPMGFRDENQEIVGFDIDVATEVCKRMGVELVLQPISWEAKEQELATKNIDCIWNGFSSSPERQEALTCSIPYLKNTQVAVVAKDSEVVTLDDLAGKKVIIQNGSTAAEAIDENEEFKNSLGAIVMVEDNVKALMDLQQGGSDAVVLDEVVARYYTEKEEGKYNVLESALSDEEYVIGFRKGDQALCDRVNQILQEMNSDGTLKEISEKWFGEDLTIVK